MVENSRRRKNSSILYVFLLLALIAVITGIGTVAASQAGGEGVDLPNVKALEIGDQPNDAELEDLQLIAEQSGISLQDAIERYGWNDNFALVVANIRDAYPAAFGGAEIVDGGTGWIAFAAGAPQGALDMIEAFGSSHDGVLVGVRTGLGFTEAELQSAIEAAHYAVFESPGVRDASTAFDYETGQITTNVVLENMASDSAIDDLQVVAAQSVSNATRPDIFNSIQHSVLRSESGTLGGDESGTEHLGGEYITDYSYYCTSGFGVK